MAQMYHVVTAFDADHAVEKAKREFGELYDNISPDNYEFEVVASCSHEKLTAFIVTVDAKN
jgi:hypothetical protein